MADLAKKLGIKAGQRVCLLDAPYEAASIVRNACEGLVQVFTSLDRQRFDMIMFWPQQLQGLASRFAQLQHSILPDGALWAVLPKKKYALQRGVDFTWEAMQAAGLETDLVDNKVASIGEQDYGTRFVIRKERRSSYA